MYFGQLKWPLEISPFLSIVYRSVKILRAALAEIMGQIVTFDKKGVQVEECARGQSDRGSASGVWKGADGPGAEIFIEIGFWDFMQPVVSFVGNCASSGAGKKSESCMETIGYKFGKIRSIARLREGSKENAL